MSICEGSGRDLSLITELSAIIIMSAEEFIVHLSVWVPHARAETLTAPP